MKKQKKRKPLKRRKKSKSFSMLKLFRYFGALGGVTGITTFINNLGIEIPWIKKPVEEPVPVPQQPINIYMIQPPQATQPFIGDASTSASSVAQMAPRSENFQVMSAQAMPDFDWYIDILNFMIYSPVSFWTITVSIILVIAWVTYELINKFKKPKDQTNL